MRRNLIILSTVIIFLGTLLIAGDQSSVYSAEKSSSKKGYLGVSVKELNRHLKKELKADYGVVITSIVYDSPADEYGLMEDDVIQKVNNIKIRRPSTLTRIIRKIKPGEKAKIVVIRDGKTKTITVKIGKFKSGKNYSMAISPDIKVFNRFAGGAFLGVQLHELNKDLAAYFGVREDEGALVLEVEEDSPAEAAGMKAGDVIIKIDGEPISEPEDVQDIISELEEDDQIKIEIIRQERKQTLEASLEEREGYHNFFRFPGKNIQELKYRFSPEKSIDLFFDGRKMDKDKRIRKIIIERQRFSSSKAI